MGRSTEFYRTNEEGRRKKLRYQKEYNARPEVRKRRAASNRARRKMKNMGHDVDGKDVAHTPDGLTVKSRKANRGSRSDMPGDKRARGKKKSKQ